VLLNSLTKTYEIFFSMKFLGLLEIYSTTSDLYENINYQK